MALVAWWRHTGPFRCLLLPQHGPHHAVLLPVRHRHQLVQPRRQEASRPGLGPHGGSLSYFQTSSYFHTSRLQTNTSDLINGLRDAITLSSSVPDVDVTISQPRPTAPVNYWFRAKSEAKVMFISSDIGRYYRSPFSPVVTVSELVSQWRKRVNHRRCPSISPTFRTPRAGGNGCWVQWSTTVRRQIVASHLFWYWADW